MVKRQSKPFDLCRLKPKSLRVVEATLGKFTDVKKPVAKFVIHIAELRLAMLQVSRDGIVPSKIKRLES
jgi:hypothetical protein